MSDKITETILFEETQNSGELADTSLQNADSIISKYSKSSADTDELITITDTLGGIAGSIRTATDDDGITEATAMALGIAVEHLCNRSGLPKTPVFALEGFRGMASRKQSTKIALESITGVIKAIIKKILKWLKIAMSYLYDTMQELTQGADNIANKARELQEKAKGIAHKSIKESSTTISNGSLTTFFSQKGKVIAADNIHTVYEDYSVLMNRNFSSGFVKEVALRINEAMEEAKAGESEEATAGKINKLISNLKDKAFSPFKEESSSEASDILKFELPFGQRDIVVSLTKDKGLFTGLNVLTEKAKANSSNSSENKLEVLNYGQIIEITKEVEKQMLFGLFKNYKSSKSELSKIERIITRGCEEITRNQQSGNSNGEITVGFSVHFLKDLASSLVSMTAVTHKYDIFVSRNLLEYCEYSIKMHS